MIRTRPQRALQPLGAYAALLILAGCSHAPDPSLFPQEGQAAVDRITAARLANHIEVLSGDAYSNHGSFVPGGGNSIGYEDLKTIEALEYIKAVAENRPNKPSFADALANASEAAAMVRSWESEKWEQVVSLRID